MDGLSTLLASEVHLFCEAPQILLWVSNRPESICYTAAPLHTVGLHRFPLLLLPTDHLRAESGVLRPAPAMAGSS